MPTACGFISFTISYLLRNARFAIISDLAAVKLFLLEKFNCLYTGVFIGHSFMGIVANVAINLFNIYSFYSPVIRGRWHSA